MKFTEVRFRFHALSAVCEASLGLEVCLFLNRGYVLGFDVSFGTRDVTVGCVLLI